MLDVVTSLRALEHRAEEASKGEAATDVCVGLGVEARNLGVLLGMSRLPGFDPDVRERAMMLTHHGEALARAALTPAHDDARLRELMQEVEMDTHLLRGALETADLDSFRGV